MDRELKCLDCASDENDDKSSKNEDAQDIKNINIEIQGNIKTQVNRA